MLYEIFLYIVCFIGAFHRNKENFEDHFSQYQHPDIASSFKAKPQKFSLKYWMIELLSLYVASLDVFLCTQADTTLMWVGKGEASEQNYMEKTLLSSIIHHFLHNLFLHSAVTLVATKHTKPDKLWSGFRVSIIFALHFIRAND